MLIKFEGGVKDVPVSEVTAENYICPEDELHGYHVKMEIVRHDTMTGKKISKPRVQKFDKKVFPTIRPILEAQGYTLEILHDPKDFAAKTAKQIEEEKIAKIIQAERAKWEAEMKAKETNGKKSGK